MADTLIGTTPCPQCISIRFVDGVREDIMCPNVGQVYQMDDGVTYKSVCSGSVDAGGFPAQHSHFFGAYYLDKVTPIP